MADDAMNQKQFAEDVAAAAAAGGGEAFMGDPNSEFKMPSVEEVWKIIEQMSDISDEERAELRKNLYSPTEGNPEDFMKRYVQPEMGHTTWDYTIFIAMIMLVVLVFALFGFKLYKSLKEKELKKQGKLKNNKQAKKAKKSN